MDTLMAPPNREHEISMAVRVDLEQRCLKAEQMVDELEKAIVELTEEKHVLEAEVLELKRELHAEFGGMSPRP